MAGTDLPIDISRFDGAEFVITGDGSPIIISGGKVLKLSFRTEGDQGHIELVDNTGAATTLASGPIGSISDNYSQLRLGLAKPKAKPYNHRRADAVFLIGFLGLAAAWLFLPEFKSSDINPEVAAITERLADIETSIAEVKSDNAAINAEFADAREVIQFFGNVANEPMMVPLEGPGGGETANVGADGSTMLPPITVRPDGNVSTTDEETASDVFSQLPPFDPSAFAPVAAETPVPSHEDIGDDSADPDVVTPTDTGGAQNPEAEIEEVPTATDNEPADEQEQISAVENEEETEVVDFEQARQQARSAVDGLIADGMTEDDAIDVLAQLEELARSDFSEITPETLASLPHEIAHMLVEQGLVSESLDAPDGVPYRIIRLSEDVIRDYRGPDGIASIPDTNTWASTGNFVSIPLPGGGDIKTPDDMLDFGLQP